MTTPSSSDVVTMLCDYGAEAHRHQKFSTGAVAFRRALSLDPNRAAAYNGLGAMLREMGDYPGAETALLRALSLEPGSSAACGNLGLTYAAMHRWTDAELAYQRGLAFAPGDAGLRWNRANMLLEKGDWTEGLTEYETRIQHRGPPNFPRMPYPMWQGEDLTNKTIFIQAEQGIGDRILASRYLPWLKAQGQNVRIIYLSNSNMHSLMWEFSSFVEFIPEGNPWPQADYGLFEMSLLGLYQKMERAPNAPGQIVCPGDSGLIRKRAEIDRRGVNLPEPHQPSLKVGLCWTGNAAFDRNAERSIPLEALLPLAEHPDVTLYSLQVGSKDIVRLGANQLISDITQDFDGKLTRTAAAMLHLDLVITTCTSVAHLAGALGVPTWVMLCHNPYWAWLHDRPDSVWYPSVVLFRQSTPGQWGPVVNNVRHQLNHLAHTKLRQQRVA